MADKKVIFVAFAVEDEKQRDLLKGQSLNTKSPFEYIDMSVKEGLYVGVEGASPYSHSSVEMG